MSSLARKTGERTPKPQKMNRLDCLYYKVKKKKKKKKKKSTNCGSLANFMTPKELHIIIVKATRDLLNSTLIA
jgi:hypothetical protein